MYCCRGIMLSRINERRVVPSGSRPNLLRRPASAVMLRGPLAMTGGGIPARSPVPPALLTRIALGALPVAEVSVPQVDGTDSAPTVAARPIEADTAPPV